MRRLGGRGMEKKSKNIKGFFKAFLFPNGILNVES